jgi:beta-lactam-binding protein with PASTA domain
VTRRPAGNGPELVPAGIVVEDESRMPDVRGKSAREAVQILARWGIRNVTEGDGFVVAQSPEPGAELTPRTRATIRLSRGPEKTGVRR